MEYWLVWIKDLKKKNRTAVNLTQKYVEIDLCCTLGILAELEIEIIFSFIEWLFLQQLPYHKADASEMYLKFKKIK